MENLTCQMDCHACTLQKGVIEKSVCASLLMPAMFNRITTILLEIKERLQDLKTIATDSTKINEVKLSKKQKNEYNKSNSTIAVSSDEGEGGNG